MPRVVRKRKGGKVPGISARTHQRKPKGKSAVKYLPFADLTPAARRFVRSLPEGTTFTIEGTGKYYQIVRVGNRLRPKIVDIKKIRK